METSLTVNDGFNIRTNTLLYENISLTLYSQEGDVCCVWEMSWRQGRTVILTQVLPLNHSSTSSLSWLGLLNHGSLRAAKLSVWSWFSLRHPVSNWLEPSEHLLILLSNAHLLPLFFCLFTQVHLLIDGSVKGQYITLCCIFCNNISICLKSFVYDWHMISSIPI